jgi:hypothetical protein
LPGCRALNTSAEFQRRRYIVKQLLYAPLPVSITDPQLKILPVTLSKKS